MEGLQGLAAHWRSKFSPRVIGITGSVGKSTTKEMISTVLGTRFNVLKNQGNLNNEIGLPLTLLNLNSSHERVVLEMGMYDLGEIALLAEIARPQVGVITNVGPTHLERLGTIERIAQAKTELVQALPAAEAGGIAILNDDDPLARPMAEATEAQVLTYGLSSSADLWGSDVESAGLEGIRFTFHYEGDEIRVRVPLLGRHSVHTALRAALVGLVEGLDWEEIITGLQTLPSADQLRLVAMPGPNDSILLDDTYNASPASTLAALNLLDDLAADLVVMAVGLRPNVELAQAAGLRCERGILVSDTLQTFDPRVYAVGECVQHRDRTFGLVAPQWDQARVCADHLAGIGIGRYEGEVASTPLKVSGIDVFSAGDLSGGPGAESLVLSDPRRGDRPRPLATANASTAGGHPGLATRSTRVGQLLLHGQTAIAGV